MDLTSFAALAGVTFFATTVQAATGFGFALVAVPFFLLVMGSLEAIQVAGVVSLVISIVLLKGLLQNAPWKLLTYIVAGSIAGFPVGLVAFRAADLGTVQLAIGALITLLATLLIAREWAKAKSGSPAKDNAAGDFSSKPVIETLVGFASGVMAVALAMPGPAVVLYLSARRASKQVSRPATLLLFLFSYAAVSIVHTLWGGMTRDSWLLAAQLTPFIFAGTFAGHVASKSLSDDSFRKVVLIILIASGLYAIWAAL